MRHEPCSDPLWYKDAVIYQAHVRAFFDSNGDGIGDFPGLTQKLDYLQQLGVNCLWLLPFYPSPLRDDGYDISHYEGIHPSYGTMRDFRAFMREAHERGLRVITELVVNHTSDQHPWFQAARRAPAGSSKRDFYVWSDTKERYKDVRIIFTDSEPSNWSWDDEAKAYYWHRFFHHQPDLNFDNPKVLRAIQRVMRFWLDAGVDGLRLDAVPYLIEREGTICENLPETHEILRTIRRELDARYRCRMLLAEANQWPADVRPYFGAGDECHMAFHFPVMPRMFMAIRQEDRHPITEILRQTPDIPDLCQWALFLRNHDEMTLEMVSDEERDYMYGAYAADPQMRINVGIRRRLAPLVENSRPRIELLNSLLFSLPGTPVLYYGDELGMGDNIYLGDRNGVRTPMQWTSDRNGGFSRADPARLYAPPIMDPVYGYNAINVEAQERSPFSLLNWMRRMIGVRKQHRTFGRGSTEFLQPQNRKVLAFIRKHEEETILVVANLARSVQPVELDLAAYNGYTPVEMLGLTEFPRIGELPYFLTPGPYSFYWFQLQRTPAPIAVRVAPEPAHEVELPPALMMGPAWDTLFDGNVRTLVEHDGLLPFLLRQRWFGGKARNPGSCRIVEWALVARSPEIVFLTLVEVVYADGSREIYSVPMGLKNGPEADDVLKNHVHAVIAPISGARKGVLYDPTIDPRFAATLLGAIEDQREIAARGGSVIRALTTSAFAAARGPGDEPLAGRRSTAEQSNTSILYGKRLIMKLFRRVELGPNPDFEIGRQLTERAGFTRTPSLAGAIEYQRPGEEPATLAMLQAFVPSQANGWEHAVEELRRYLDRVQGRPPIPVDAAARTLLDRAALTPADDVRDAVGGYLESAALLGRRTAELHLALASDLQDPAFTPEPIESADLATMGAEMLAHGRAALATLAERVDQLSGTVGEWARQILDKRERLFERFTGLASLRFAASRIRVHGDYHLGQVLWSEGDFVIFDFEGEPARPLAARRAKQSPLKDVAGMLRSFSYAAYAGLFMATVHHPDDFDRLEPWARLWEFWCSAAFLRAYLDVARGASFLPAGRAELEALLETFALDKALYESLYELNNRPDWLRIPLWGMLPLVAEPDAPA